jgi:hypothetical protein
MRWLTWLPDTEARLMTMDDKLTYAVAGGDPDLGVVATGQIGRHKHGDETKPVIQQPLADQLAQAPGQVVDFPRRKKKRH